MKMFVLNILFVFSIDVFMVSCDKSLTFVIDNTYSMKDDIVLVRDVANSLMDVILDKDAKIQISNMLLVTFNDPDGFTERLNTTERTNMTTALENLTVNGGGDCSELPMSGIKRALELSLPGSYIYVFTDATAKDYNMIKEIQELCQMKQSEIVFIIMLPGYCGNLRSQEFEVYYNITTASSGLAIRVPKDDVKSVVKKFAEEDIKGNKIDLVAQLTPANVRTSVSFFIDDLTTYAIISASGLNVQLNHFKELTIKLDPIIWSKHTKVIKLWDMKPGNYTVSVKSESPTSIVITGRTDFYFRPGFSKRKPKSFIDTKPMPYSDTLTRLSLLVTDPQYSVKILSAQILVLNESVIMNLPLEELSLNLYTTKVFLAPSDVFKVALIGEVIQTGQPIRRIAKIPVKPETLPLEAPKVLGVKIQEVRVGGSVSVKCNVVKGVPKPTLIWQFKPASGSEYADTNNTGSEWHISHVTDNDSGYYKCTATNSQGTDEHIVQLTVKGPAKTSDDKSLRLPCDTFSYPKPTVRWEVNGSPITPGDKYSIDDGDLIIKNPTDSDNNNEYSCTATRTFKAFMGDHSGDYGISQNVYLLQNHTLKLTCSLPRIGLSAVTWYRDGEDIGSNDTNISVVNAQVDDDGNYTCHVCDMNGSAKKTFIVDMGYPPAFKFPHEKIVPWSRGTTTFLRCDSIAKPPPIVEWRYKGGKPLAETSMLLKVTNFGRYECTVSNAHGAVQRSFKVITSDYLTK